MIQDTPVTRILEEAKWAPSGDNTQPWQFQIVDKMHFNVITEDTRNWCVYDIDGKASMLAVGALLENITIAAAGQQLKAEFRYQNNGTRDNPVISVALTEQESKQSHPLQAAITQRVTQRRPFKTTPLTIEQKENLTASVGPDYQVLWAEKDKKTQMALTMFRSANIHLSIPEGFQVHKRIIAWGVRYSEDKIPDQAIGLDPIAVMLMKWTIKSWKRVAFLNKYMAGTLLPRIQLNLIPGLKCAAHFTIVARQEPKTPDDFIQAGRALQRFWLTATSLGLLLQPEMAPLLFCRFSLKGIKFTKDTHALKLASELPDALIKVFGDHKALNRVFMGRLGTGKSPKSRSIRKSLKDLVV